MITVLASTVYKAASTARKCAVKGNKNLPIMDTLYLWTENGQMMITPFTWEERREKTQAVPARVDQEFSTCVPSRPFVDWLRASQLTREEKRKGMTEQVSFTFCQTTQVLTIKAGNTRAQFKCIDAQEFPPV